MFKRLFVLFVSVAMLCLDVTATVRCVENQNEKTAPSVVVDVHSPGQNILFVGGDMERSQSFLQKAGDPECVARWCFGDVHFDVCRVSYDKKQELQEGNKNLSFYDDAIKSMQLLKKVNPTIKFWATMKSDYNGYGNENNLPDWICDYKPTTHFNCEKYAAFLADYLELMQTSGVAISYLAVAKEWTGVVTAKRAKTIIERLNEICYARGIDKPKYVDPASWSITQGVKFLKQVDEAESVNLYYGFSTHNLDKKEHDSFKYDEFVAKVKSCGKLAFADESGTGAGGPTNGLEPATMKNILAAYTEKAHFYAAGMQGELFFEPFSRGVNRETRTIYFKKGGEAKRMRAYYVMRNFVNGIAGKGMCYVPTYKHGLSDSVYTMSFVNGECVFLVVVNASDRAIGNVEISLQDGTKITDCSGAMFDATLPIDGKAVHYKSKRNKVSVDCAGESIMFLTLKTK